MNAKVVRDGHEEKGRLLNQWLISRLIRTTLHSSGWKCALTRAGHLTNKVYIIALKHLTPLFRLIDKSPPSAQRTKQQQWPNLGAALLQRETPVLICWLGGVILIIII
jgi:hypothetical protein